MDLKQKIAKIKDKYEEYSDEIIAVTTTVTAVLAVGAALRYKRKFEIEKADHLDCHGFSQWVLGIIEDGEPRLIQRQGSKTRIRAVNTEE